MRRIPGPASRLSQDRVHINGENTPNLSIQTTTEVLSPTQSNHFLVISALRSLFGLSSDDLSRDVKDTLRTYCLAPISDVQEGLHDLVIAGLVAVIEEVSVAYDGSVSLSLQDGTGSVNGFLSPEEMARLQQAFPRLLLLISPGNVIFLQGVAIYVAKNPFQRLLSITHRNITSIIEGERRTRRTDSD